MPVLHLPSERGACRPSGSGGRCDWSWRRWRGRAARSPARRWGSKWSQRSYRRSSLAPCLHICRRERAEKRRNKAEQNRGERHQGGHLNTQLTLAQPHRPHTLISAASNPSTVDFPPTVGCLIHWTDFRINGYCPDGSCSLIPEDRRSHGFSMAQLLWCWSWAMCWAKNLSAQSREELWWL